MQHFFTRLFFWSPYPTTPPPLFLSLGQLFRLMISPPAKYFLLRSFLNEPPFAPCAISCHCFGISYLLFFFLHLQWTLSLLQFFLIPALSNVAFCYSPPPMSLFPLFFSVPPFPGLFLRSIFWCCAHYPLFIPFFLLCCS